MMMIDITKSVNIMNINYSITILKKKSLERTLKANYLMENNA